MPGGCPTDICRFACHGMTPAGKDRYAPIRLQTAPASGSAASPKDATILTVQLQDGKPVLWALVEVEDVPAKNAEDRHFRLLVLSRGDLK